MQGDGGQTRGRVAIAIAAGIASIGIIAIVAVASGGGSDEPEAVAAPPRCVKAWNADPAARAYGRHNFNFHLYEGALVTVLTATGGEVEASGGKCAVVFPSRALDPEPAAAGELLLGTVWVPISQLAGVQLRRVADLQLSAAKAPNTRLGDDGLLTPL